MKLKLHKVTMLAALAMAAATPAAYAQIPGWNIDGFQAPADPRWSPIAVRDVAAAYRIGRLLRVRLTIRGYS